MNECGSFFFRCKAARFGGLALRLRSAPLSASFFCMFQVHLTGKLN